MSLIIIRKAAHDIQYNNTALDTATGAICFPLYGVVLWDCGCGCGEKENVNGSLSVCTVIHVSGNVWHVWHVGQCQAN